METEFTQHTIGKLVFDVEDLTNKHRQQSTWKKHAIAYIDNPDFCDYYSWFIKKRYNITTIPRPIRGTHLTLINDRLGDFNVTEERYREIKEKYDGTEIDIRYSLSPRTDGKHWWMRSRTDLGTQIRTELGLSPKPYFGYHITVGRHEGKNWEKEHGKYIHTLLKKGIISEL